MLTNINCKHNLYMYLACSSINFLCPTCKITLQKWAIAQVLVIRKGRMQEVLEKVLEGRKGFHKHIGTNFASLQSKVRYSTT